MKLWIAQSLHHQFLEITSKKISRQRVGWGGGRAKHVFTFDPQQRQSSRRVFRGGTPIANLGLQRSLPIFQDWPPGTKTQGKIFRLMNAIVSRPTR